MSAIHLARDRVLALITTAAVASCALVPRAGDPHRLVADDPRVVECGIPIADMWMAFPMSRASDVGLHFPGWTQGNDELQVPDPALVIIGPPHQWTDDSAYFDMCIAVGPPDDALLHRYSGVRFDAVRPDLGGPAYPMPTSGS